MLDISQCSTLTDFVPSDLATLHGDSAEEEKFLRCLEKFRRVYFDWGCGSFHIQILEIIHGGNSDDAANWVAITTTRFAQITKIPAMLATDAIKVLASIGVDVVITNYSKYGPKNDNERAKFLETIRESVPEMKVTFLGHTE